jgi:hypothetical protein
MRGAVCGWYVRARVLLEPGVEAYLRGGAWALDLPLVWFSFLFLLRGNDMVTFCWVGIDVEALLGVCRSRGWLGVGGEKR